MELDSTIVAVAFHQPYILYILYELYMVYIIETPALTDAFY